MVGQTHGKLSNVINPHLPLVSVLCLQKTILRMQMLPGGTVSNINPEIATHLAERNFTTEPNSSLVEYCSGFPDSLVHMCRVSGSNFNLYGTFFISDISCDNQIKDAYWNKKVICSCQVEAEVSTATDILLKVRHLFTSRSLKMDHLRPILHPPFLSLKQ